MSSRDWASTERQWFQSFTLPFAAKFSSSFFQQTAPVCTHFVDNGNAHNFMQNRKKFVTSAIALVEVDVFTCICVSLFVPVFISKQMYFTLRTSYCPVEHHTLVPRCDLCHCATTQRYTQPTAATYKLKTEHQGTRTTLNPRDQKDNP